MRLGYREMKQITANPSFNAAVKELRSHPYLGDHYKRVPKNSVEMVDAVKKLIDKDVEALTMAPKGIDRFAGAAASSQKSKMVDIAKQAAPEYATALERQQQLRRGVLEPVQQGALGRIAQSDELSRQLDQLFPRNPMPNSDKSVGNAIRTLTIKDPKTAENLIGAHIERTFMEASRTLASGPNQAGGARFVALIRGNTQQAINLREAIRTLPNGDTRLAGFTRLLENLEATGTRKPANSATSINEMIKQDLKGGSLTGKAAATALAPQRAFSVVKDAYDSWRLGRNTHDLARLFLDPDAGKLMAQLAMTNPGTAEAIELTARVLLITQAADKGIMNPDRDHRE